MSKFRNAKIYKLISAQTPLIYIGSTYQTLYSRMSGHRRDYNYYVVGNGSDLNSKRSNLDILQYNDTRIVLIERFPCKSREEMVAREQYWIDKTLNCVNNYRAKGLPKREADKVYYEANKERILQKQKDDYHNNKPKYQQKSKDCRERNKEAIKIAKKIDYEKNKDHYTDYKKKWYLKRREQEMEKRKVWYQANKEKLSVKVRCACGVNISNNHLRKHMKTPRHFALMDLKRYLESDDPYIVSKEIASFIESLEVQN